MDKEDRKTRCEWCDKRSMVSPCKECLAKERKETEVGENEHF